MEKYARSFTSGGKKVSTANQVISFVDASRKNDNRHYNDSTAYNSVQSLTIETFGEEIKYKLNNEATIHWLDANSTVTISNMDIEKFTIVDAGVNYYYTAFSVK